MGFNCGIVGLPNVGKSTIFNALTSGKAESANYPFCTIDPNTGIVAVPDSRLQVLADIAGSKELIPTAIEFVDIAGLVKGASQGEGLGNQFLGHIRSVDAVAHVVRCFEDENVTHVHGSVDPKRDVEIVETELLLSDLTNIEKRIERISKAAKSGDKALKEELSLLERAREHLGAGTQLYRTPEATELSHFDLLTSKPVLFVANVAEGEVAVDPHNVSAGHIADLMAVARERGAEVVVISGQVEAEIAQLEIAERADFLSSLGLTQSGLDRLALEGYRLLDLITFFTVGPKEAHAWTCARGTLAPQAAGKIHSDFEKGFIRAEIIAYDDYVSCRGELGAKEKGLLRVEGRGYEVKDGDVVHFRFNV